MFSIKDSNFYEIVNISKLRYIVNNPKDYEDVIKAEEKLMRRENKNYNAFAVFQKMIQNSVVPHNLEGTELAYVKTKYVKGSKSNDIGRWYANKSIGLAPLCCCVRHTICQGLWYDIDQVNSHPTIFKNFMDKFGFESKTLNYCFNKREKFLAKIMKEIHCSRDDAKMKVIGLINGGSTYKSEILEQLKNEIMPCVEKIISLPQYADIFDFVKNTYPDDKNITGKTISRILQVVENDILERYVEFFYEKGFIKKVLDGYEIALIFDGFQIRSEYDVNDDILAECRKYAFDKTGYDIELKIKPFDNPLILPDNYILFEDEIPSIVEKYKEGIDIVYEKNSKQIEAVVEMMSDHDIMKIVGLIVKDKIVYDPDTERWFHCNNANIWKEYKEPVLIKALLPEVVSILFKISSINWYKKSVEGDIDDDDRKKYKKKSENAIKVVKELKGSRICKNIKEHSHLFIKDKFKEEYLDSKAYLFAFNNKVFDFSIKPDTDKLSIYDFIRYIKPKDYIQTYTNYDFPEFVYDDDTEFIEKYFTDLFPDEDKRNYVLDSFASTLNGDNKEQYFNIHTGSGSNSKTSLMNLFSSALGYYSVNISPETFTKAKRSANENGELYKAKGKRNIICNEPDDENDNKMQTAMLKKIADEGNQTIIAKELYKNPIEFKNQTTLNFAMNNKPALSTVDGGISRRIRIIQYDVKFVDEPQEGNKFQKKLDPNVISVLTSNNMRNTFIIMLLKRWVGRVRLTPKINVPECIKNDSNQYVSDCNSVLGFLIDCKNYTISQRTTDRVKSSKVFSDFKDWLKRNKPDEIVSDKKFKEYMLNIAGVEFKKSKTGRYFTGIMFKKINNDSDDSDDSDDEE